MDPEGSDDDERTFWGGAKSGSMALSRAFTSNESSLYERHSRENSSTQAIRQASQDVASNATSHVHMGSRLNPSTDGLAAASRDLAPLGPSAPAPANRVLSGPLYQSQASLSHAAAPEVVSQSTPPTTQKQYSFHEKFSEYLDDVPAQLVMKQIAFHNHWDPVILEKELRIMDRYRLRNVRGLRSLSEESWSIVPLTEDSKRHLKEAIWRMVLKPNASHPNV